ncbi:MAG: type II toxin-antitoxin system Phd/YefM family antitoxin [Thermoanaerobaculia bacterium]
MKVVGIREFKDRLSEYVRMAKRGEDILLTERGEVVAELRGPDAIGRPVHPDPGIADLIRRGLVSHIGTNSPQAYPPLGRILRGKTAAQLLDEERGDR